MKWCEHDFTIVIVVKLLVNGHCSDSGLHNLLSRGSRCPQQLQAIIRHTVHIHINIFYGKYKLQGNIVQSMVGAPLEKQEETMGSCLSKPRLWITSCNALEFGGECEEAIRKSQPKIWATLSVLENMKPNFVR